MKSTGGEEAAAFFNGFANRFDTPYDEQRAWPMRWVDRHFRSDMFIQFQRTFEQLGDLTGQSVLDIGCGSGPYMLEADRQGARMVTGLDPAPNMLKLAHQRLERAGFSGRHQPVEGIGLLAAIYLRKRGYKKKLSGQSQHNILRSQIVLIISAQ